ncbi:MAG: LCP family protein [Parcubacteria group bacterium]|nr:LCP family protein [Parcubacteria group bacterium]
MAAEIKSTSSSSQSSGLGLVFFVLLMLATDVWMFQKVFAGNSKTDLPQIKFNPVSASALILKRYDPADYGLDKPVNILVLGKSGGQYIAPNLTDTIFVARIDPQPSPRLKIVSIPRDLAVKTADQKTTKINGLYQLGLRKSQQEGLNLIQTKVEEVTGLKTDYFVIFDLATVEKIIDDIGGINVAVTEDIYDPRFPSESGGYETFRLASGLRYLDGKTALRVVRTRASPRGDFDRIKRQQAVLKAIKGKLLSLNPIWDFPKLWNIFRTVQKNIYTDLELANVKELWSAAKLADLDNVQTLNLDLESGLVKEQKTQWGGQAVYILVAKDKPFEYTNIQKEIISFLGN